MKCLVALAFSLTLVSAPVAGQSLASVEAQLIPSLPQAGDLFGDAAALSGDTVVFGAPGKDELGPHNGSAVVYRRSAGVWSLEQVLVAFDGAPKDSFGFSVAISGDTILVGAYRDDDQGKGSGSVYVFVRSGTTWALQAKLLSSDGEKLDWFGRAVALEGERALIGAPRDDDAGNLSGSVYAFSRSGVTWTEDEKLTASDGMIRAEFGSAVALRGGLAVIGAPKDEVGTQPPGAAYAFRWNGSSWGEEAKFVASNGFPYDKFGAAVAVSGDVIAIGAPGYDFPQTSAGGAGVGAAYVFERSGTVWAEVAFLHDPDPDPGFYFGEALALEGGTLLIGAPGADGSELRMGRALLYRRTANEWAQLTSVEESTPGFAFRFGSSVALSAEYFVVGAGRLFDAGRAYGYRIAAASGAATYCTAGTSASGCVALLQASGQASASDTSGFYLSVAGMEGSKDGLFFFGSSGRQATAWGNGTSFMCVAPPRARGALLSAAGSTTGACDGMLVEDLNARWCPSCTKPQLNPGAGAVVQAQLWYRDPLSSSNQSSSLSNAVEFVVLP